MLVELWMWLILVLMLALIAVQNIGLRERISRLEATRAAEHRGQTP